MIRAKAWLILLILFTFSLSLPSNIAFSKENSLPLRIAVASNFTPALKKLLIPFQQKTGITSQIISGSTGSLFLQIKHGAPFDVFISADSSRPAALEHAQLTLPNSRKTYAIGQLALYSINNSPTYLLQLDSLQEIPRYFAIANPDTAPYGKAAKETFQHLGLWDKYQNSFIVGLNVNQTFSQLHSKSVPLGLIAHSQLVHNKMLGVVIPEQFHQKIEQQLVIIKSSKNIIQAKQLSDFLLSNSIQQQIASYGYLLDKETDAKL